MIFLTHWKCGSENNKEWNDFMFLSNLSARVTGNHVGSTSQENSSQPLRERLVSNAIELLHMMC